MNFFVIAVYQLQIELHDIFNIEIYSVNVIVDRYSIGLNLKENHVIHSVNVTTLTADDIRFIK